MELWICSTQRALSEGYCRLLFAGVEFGVKASAEEKDLLRRATEKELRDAVDRTARVRIYRDGVRRVGGTLAAAVREDIVVLRLDGASTDS